MTADPTLSLFADVGFPAKLKCDECFAAATVLDADQAARWLKGHGSTFHDGPFQVHIWSSVEALRYEPGELAAIMREAMKEVDL